MDIASVIGLVAAFILIVMAMGDPSVFIDVPSVLIVIGGTAATVLNTTTIPGLIGAIKVFLKSILNSPEPPEKTIEQLVELGTIAKKDGFVALEGQEIKNPFMARGVRMLVDGTDPALIKQSMQTEMDQIKARSLSARLIPQETLNVMVLYFCLALGPGNLSQRIPDEILFTSVVSNPS